MNGHFLARASGRLKNGFPFRNFLMLKLLNNSNSQLSKKNHFIVVEKSEKINSSDVSFISHIYHFKIPVGRGFTLLLHKFIIFFVTLGLKILRLFRLKG